jgi:ABC-type amino acid transport substrate-binding protein
LAVALGFAASACLAQSVTLDKIRKSGTITLGYVEGAVPFSFVHEGEPQGYSVELCRRIAGDLRRQLKLTKLDTKWVALTVQNRLEAVRKGQVDLECSTTSRTLSRQELVDFSLMTFVDGASVLIRAADSFRRLGDFGGKKIAVLSGTTTESGIRQTLDKLRVDAQLVPVKTRAEGLEMLDKGAVDGLVSDRIALFGAAATAANPNSYRLLDDIYTVEPYALPLRRGDSDFRLAVDRSLAGLYREGGIAEIYGKWFGRLGPAPAILEALYLLQGYAE